MTHLSAVKKKEAGLGAMWRDVVQVMKCKSFFWCTIAYVSVTFVAGECMETVVTFRYHHSLTHRMPRTVGADVCDAAVSCCRHTIQQLDIIALFRRHYRHRW